MTNFESFSEDLVPRITPQPAVVPALNISKPIVPEVSIIFDETKLDADQTTSYKQWRDKQRTQVAPTNSGERNAIEAKTKFVKFDCVDHSGSEQPRQIIPTYSPAPYIDANSRKTNVIHSSGNPMAGNGNGMTMNQYAAVNRNQQPIETHSTTGRAHSTVTGMPTALRPIDAANAVSKPAITMEDMYQLMSLQRKRMEADDNRNTPNVQPPPPAQKEITLNEVFQLLLQTQQAQNQLPPQPVAIPPVTPPAPVQMINQPVAMTRTVPTEITCPSDGEPSLKDLFHIIVKQQEQLINIQKQVQAILVQNTSRPPHNDHHRPICDAYNQFNMSSNPMGVMTSLEINVQKYSKKSPTDRKLTPASQDRALQCCTNCRSPLTQNGPENMNILNEINVEQQQDSPDSDQNTPNDWTIYGNILNQVNHVLQNSPPVNADNRRVLHNEQAPVHPITQAQRTSSTPSSGSSSLNCNVFGPTPHPQHIRTAQFQQIGLKFDDVNVSATSKRVTFDTTANGMKRAQPPTFDQSTTTTDKSVIMNALAMKYLPIEQQQRQQSSPNHASPVTNQVTLAQTMATAAVATYNTASNRNQPKSPSDMSIASYRYMEKYGLL